MSASFKFTGLAEMQRKIQAAADNAKKELGRALREEMDTVAEEAKAQTPVKTGALRETVRAEGPFYEGDRISAAVVAGGPGVKYAVRVHEDLEAEHAVGNAKFVERPLMASAQSLIVAVAKRAGAKHAKS